MKVQLDKQELWPYYEEWSGFGRPDYDLEIPEDLYTEYKQKKGDFFIVLDKMAEFLNDK